MQARQLYREPAKNKTAPGRDLTPPGIAAILAYGPGVQARLCLTFRRRVATSKRRLRCENPRGRWADLVSDDLYISRD